MATITLDKTTIKAGETAVVTFTVEKTHFMGTLNRSGVRTVVDVTIIGGTISAGYDFRYVEALSTPTTQVYQGDFTPTPNLDRTECRISYNPPGTANDATSATFIVDTRAPTLTGTPTIDNRNLIHANQVTTISFVFSEQLDQASFTTADLTIPAGMGRLGDLRTPDGGRAWAGEPAHHRRRQVLAGRPEAAGQPGGQHRSEGPADRHQHGRHHRYRGQPGHGQRQPRHLQHRQQAAQHRLCGGPQLHRLEGHHRHHYLHLQRGSHRLHVGQHQFGQLQCLSLHHLPPERAGQRRRWPHLDHHLPCQSACRE